MELEEIFETASLLVGDLSDRIERPALHQLDMWLRSPDDLITVVAGLRVKRLGYLSAITGLDPGIEDENLEVIYHFCTGEAIINLRLNIPKWIASIPSLTEIIPSAEPYERELREMFGIKVVGLRNIDHLYLPDDWEEGFYPLRKSFPQSEKLQ